MSDALTLLTHVWKRGMKDSWGRINGSMFQALSLAIGAGLKFEAKDFEHIYSRDGFRGGYWVGAEYEWIYSSAIENGNASAYKAWEEFKGRKPFFANGVKGRHYPGTRYLHTTQMSAQRGRLAVGFSFPLDGRCWFVTGFDDEKGILRAALYERDYAQGKPKKLRKFTHEEIAELFPAPKKVKKAA
jgi:hypothetical protein